MAGKHGDNGSNELLSKSTNAKRVQVCKSLYMIINCNLNL